MERLTCKRHDSDWYPISCSSACRGGDCVDCVEFGKLVERLAAYEDTGLMPESVEALKLSMMGKVISEIKEFNGLSIDRLKELSKADKEDGRVVALPCKVGDTVYFVNAKHITSGVFSAPQKGVCEYFYYGLKRDGFEADGWYVYLKLENGKSYIRYPYALSEVHIPREEVEKALEARKDG